MCVLFKESFYQLFDVSRVSENPIETVPAKQTIGEIQVGFVVGHIDTL